MHIIHYSKKHTKLAVILTSLLILVPMVLVAACYITISPYKKFVISPQNAEHTKVGLVLGSGISREGKPYDELKARLDSAADAIDKETVDTLILSGDNRTKDYDEPSAMKRYLVDKRGIPADKLVLDFAGRSTYESCERAAKVFGVKKLIIFSAGSHLPRAIYLCRHFNVESYGISSGIEANNSTRREILARVKAVYNAQIMGERTILGEPILLK